MRNAASLLMLFALACQQDDATVDAGWPEGAAPPEHLIFQEVITAVDVNDDGMIDFLDVDENGQQVFETRYFFNDFALTNRCVYPDADSFDDFESAELQIERGTSTLTTECFADGIVTGPLHEELYPSKWCTKPSCIPDLND